MHFRTYATAVAILLDLACSSTATRHAIPTPAAPDEKRQAQPLNAEVTPAAPPSQKLTADGVSIEMAMRPIGNSNDVAVQFRITSAEGGIPMTGLNPIAWVDRSTGSVNDKKSCDTKIKSFLSGELSARPEVDLNTYSIVTLNREGNVTVIDPLFGYGGSKLLALVELNEEPADWTITPNGSQLFVTIPARNEVAVIDTSNWSVATRIPVGEKPRRVATQPDGAYVWIGNTGVDAGGISIVSANDRREVARIPAATGDHAFAFTADSHYAFATNGDGTVSVIDIRELKEVRRVATGSHPVASAYSPLANVVYIGHEDGSVAVVDAASHEVRSRIATPPGLQSIAFSPDGRWAFIPSAADNVVTIVDASSGAVTHSLTVAKGPDQVAFTDLYAYVHSNGSEDVTMIRLSSVGAGKKPAVTLFPAGQVAPEYASGRALPAAIVPAPERGTVLVANPADKNIYYYTEGMAAPMGDFQNYKREPLGVLVVNRKLRETDPGVYSTTFRVARGGKFDVPLVIDAPKFAQCFSTTLEVASDRKPQPEQLAIHIQPMFAFTIRAGEPTHIKVRVTNAKSGVPISELRDFETLTFGTTSFQHRMIATNRGGGLYEATFTPPQPGVYYVFFESRSLGKNYRDLQHWVIQATEQSQTTSSK